MSNLAAGIFICLIALTPSLAPGPARAGARPVMMERMTWEEVQARLDGGATTVLIPTGGTEQNGPHRALGKHNVIVAQTARRIAVALGDALVAPVLAYVPEGDIGRRGGHMAFAGTISVPPNVFADVLGAAAASFRAHGFRTIVFLGDSGGNQAVQEKLAARLTRKWRREGVTVVNASAYYGDNGGQAYLLDQGETAASIGRHAGIRDTSELMALDPALIRPGRLAAAATDPALGANGDPRRASAARGERLLALKVQAAVAEIRAARR
jgi:creatinine amidohydrolase/Fe(II)-dependent formamide hydrolase-like protein